LIHARAFRNTRAYVSADDGDVPGLNIFTRSDGTVRHFWSGEMSGEMADLGQADFAVLIKCQ
jgi:hypothetical protein